VPARVKHAGENRWIRIIRSAKAQGDIAKGIHGNASHPAMYPIGKSRRIGALLEDDRVTIWAAQLPPPDARHLAVRSCAGRHRLVGHQRLVIAEVAIGKPEQRPLPGQEIESTSGTRLRNTIATPSAKS
jgi:hypothetical protein